MKKKPIFFLKPTKEKVLRGCNGLCWSLLPGNKLWDEIKCPQVAPVEV